LFTGIIQEMGVLIKRVVGRDSYKIIIKAEKVLDDIKIGDSIAVNGVCLTVVSFTEDTFTVDIMPETLKQTNLSKLNIASKVNLEQAMRIDSFFGGHMLSGHVDGPGRIEKIEKKSNAHIITITTTPELSRYMINRGSVALNGISLTIVEVLDKKIIVSLIPETWSKTNFQYLLIGDEVNIENDMIAKYVYKFVNELSKGKKGIDKNFLMENGFM
jgi:riboflavin synthase